MREIIGNTTATPNPKPDWLQTDPAKADYIKNKPEILTEDDVIEIIENNGGVGGGGGSSTAYIAKTITLYAAAWEETEDGIYYTVSFSDSTVNKDSLVEVSIATDPFMMEEACRCGVYCAEQDENTLIFKAMYDVPSIQIDVNIIVFTSTNLTVTSDLIGTGVIEL